MLRSTNRPRWSELNPSWTANDPASVTDSLAFMGPSMKSMRCDELVCVVGAGWSECMPVVGMPALDIRVHHEKKSLGESF